jgi:glutathione S-transferase
MHRFRTYGVEVRGAAAAYMQAVQAHPAFVQWNADAAKETWAIEKFDNN